MAMTCYCVACFLLKEDVRRVSMVFYAALLIASIVVSSIIVWAYRAIVATTERVSTHHLPSKTQRQVIRNGVKRNTKKSQTVSARKTKTSRSSSSRLTGRNSGPNTDWGWKPNVGYPSRNETSGLSGQAYKPSQHAISAFALKTSDEKT